MKRRVSLIAALIAAVAHATAEFEWEVEKGWNLRGSPATILMPFTTQPPDVIRAIYVWDTAAHRWRVPDHLEPLQSCCLFSEWDGVLTVRATECLEQLQADTRAVELVPGAAHTFSFSGITCDGDTTSLDEGVALTAEPSSHVTITGQTVTVHADAPPGDITVRGTYADKTATATITVTDDVPPPGDEFVLLPAGTNRGTNPLAPGESYRYYYQAGYSLTVSAFYMGKYEVTKAKWNEVRAWGLTHGYSDLSAGAGKALDHPVNEVSWYDVVKWCNARSEMEGGRTPCYTASGSIYRTGERADVLCNTSASGYRLPTETEWEYAARGSLSGKRFPWGDTIDHTRANYESDWSGGAPSDPYDSGYEGNDTRYDDGTWPYTSPVASFPANGYGLYDMAGNVSEWCWDWDLYDLGTARVTRGGSWFWYAEECRVGERWLSRGPSGSDIDLGFRACLSVPGH